MQKVKIKKILKLTNKLDRYDISVRKNNNFFANGVLIHNSNAGVCWSPSVGLWTQSRKNIITPEKDNAGFSFFVESNKKDFEYIFLKINSKECIKENEIVSVFGEWAGENIQKGVGITELPKQFYVFGVKITSIADGEKTGRWIDSDWIRSENERIFNISEFKTWEMDIDFKYPESVTEKLAEITKSVGDECPVAKAFNKEGIGEGVVWTIKYKDDWYRFKVKDDRHSSSKIKKLKVASNPEKYQEIEKTINAILPAWRLEQSLTEAVEGQLQKKHIGPIINWVMSDIIKEELDVLQENKLEPRDIKPTVSERCRRFVCDKIGI